MMVKMETRRGGFMLACRCVTELFASIDVPPRHVASR